MPIFYDAKTGQLRMDIAEIQARIRQDLDQAGNWLVTVDELASAVDLDAELILHAAKIGLIYEMVLEGFSGTYYVPEDAITTTAALDNAEMLSMHQSCLEHVCLQAAADEKPPVDLNSWFAANPRFAKVVRDGFCEGYNFTDVVRHLRKAHGYV